MKLVRKTKKTIKWAWDEITFHTPRRILRVIDWLPIIWVDYDFDYSYFLKMMKFKLSRMRKCMDSGHHLHPEKDTRRIKLCELLIDRLLKNEYIHFGWKKLDKNDPKYGKKLLALTYYEDRQRKQDRELLTKTICKYLENWWD